MKTFKYKLITRKDANGKIYYRAKSKYGLFWIYLRPYDDFDITGAATYYRREEAIEWIEKNAENRRAKIYTIELIEDIET